MEKVQFVMVSGTDFFWVGFELAGGAFCAVTMLVLAGRLMDKLWKRWRKS